MDKREQYGTAVLVVLLVGTLLLKLAKHPSIQAASGLGGMDEAASVAPNSQQAFDNPFEWQTPGISDSSIVLNGGAPFVSTVNVTVNPSYLATLSEQYIPMFGFVGLGEGAGPSQGVSLSPPAPPVYYPPPSSFGSAYGPPATFSQPSPFYRPNVSAG